MITHVIFDMDGILLDTETLYTVVFQKISSKYGKTYNWSIKSKVMGMKPLPAAQIMIDDLSLPITPQELLDQAKEYQLELFPTTKLLPGVNRLIRHLHAHSIPIAVATGSSTPTFDIKTTNHKDFFALFNHIVCSDDPEVILGKPAPDCYQVASRRFKGSPPNPDNVLVFEDSPNGVLSGIAAGMKVVMIPDENLEKDLHPPDTHQFLSSMEEFVPEKWGLPPFNCIN